MKSDLKTEITVRPPTAFVIPEIHVEVMFCANKVPPVLPSLSWCRLTHLNRMNPGPTPFRGRHTHALIVKA